MALKIPGIKNPLFRQSAEDYDLGIYVGNALRPDAIIGTEELLITDATNSTTTSETFVQIKEFTIKTDQPNISLKLTWDFYASTAQLTYTKIYVNGVATGDNHTHSVPFNSSETIEETFTNLNDGDQLQVYGRVNVASGTTLTVNDYGILVINTYLKPTATDTG